MKRLVFCVLLLVACGSSGPDEPTTEDKLQGSWMFEVNAGEVIAFTFNGQAYEFDDIAVLTDGSIGMFVELGDFEVVENLLTLFPRQSSCRSGPVFTLQFSVDETRLVFVSGAQVTTFAKFTPTGTGGGGTARIGCFADDGSFTQQPVLPL